MYNTPTRIQNADAYRGNAFAVMLEPGSSKKIDSFMYWGLSQYDRVFSPIKKSKNTTVSHGYFPFLVSLKRVSQFHHSKKNKLISCIITDRQYMNKNRLRYSFDGHSLRVRFSELLKNSSLDIDYFGKGVNAVKDKTDALLDYYYSVAVENTSKDYYFSEKLLDCFACYTIPFYYGCTNIDKFFPSKSYVWIDITDPKKAIKTIRDTLEFEDPKDRFLHVQEARDVMLEKYTNQAFLRSIAPIVIKNKEKGQVKKYTFYNVICLDSFRRIIIYRFYQIKWFIYQKKLFIIKVVHRILKELKLIKFVKKILGKK